MGDRVSFPTLMSPTGVTPTSQPPPQLQPPTQADPPPPCCAWGDPPTVRGVLA